jgi:CheY-like chemotaxis protein
VAKKRIMVVEDEGIVALDIRDKLEAKGYEVAGVLASGQEAVERVGLLQPDLVLMDIQLEGELDGVQAAEQIKDRHAIPVVYLTAYSDDRTLQRAKVAEPFGYLLKPFEEKKLYATVEIALYKHQIDQEKAQLKAQLHQAQKLEAMGRLTAGLAYHFTNMLQGIQGNVDLALMQAADELKPYLEAADFEAQRASRLLRQLMLFYQHQRAERLPLKLAPIVEEVAAMCRQVFARRPGRPPHLEVNCAPDLPLIRGDAAQLRQCLASLCTSARDALESRPPSDKRPPRIELRARTVHFDQGTSLPAVAGQYVHLSIADNGPKLEAQVRERIFEPFLPTGQHGRGAELDLAMVYAIVRDHRGWIECHSAEDAGTTFALYFPVLADQEQPSSAAGPSLPPLITGEEALFADPSVDGSEQVLVIADVDRSRKMVAEMLERHGYQVLVGLDARDGLEIFQHEKEQLALVVLDLAMPGSSGQELLGQLLRLHPEVRVLVLTGYALDSSPWQGARAVLLKPFKTHQFLRTVRHVLGS